MFLPHHCAGMNGHAEWYAPPSQPPIPLPQQMAPPYGPAWHSMPSYHHHHPPAPLAPSALPPPGLEFHQQRPPLPSRPSLTVSYNVIPTPGSVPMSASNSLKAIDPAWLNIVPPTLYRSHPIIFSRRSAVSPPVTATSSFSSDPSTLVPQTPAASATATASASASDFPPLSYTRDKGLALVESRVPNGPPEWGNGNANANGNAISQPPASAWLPHMPNGPAPVSAWPDYGRASSAPGVARPVVAAPPPTQASQPPVPRPARRQDLDRYATTFVPSQYRPENVPPPTSTYTMPPRTMYPDQDYTAAVYPPQHLSGTDFLDAAGDSILTRPPSTGKVWPLTLDLPPRGTYTEHFTSLLSMSLAADLRRMQESAIPLTALEFAPASPHSSPAASFRMFVPGVREDSPRLAIGDRMILRIMQPGATPTDVIPHPIAVEAEVHGLDKKAGSVYITCPGLSANMPDYLVQHINSGGIRFQVRFLLASDPVCAMQDSVRRLGFAMDEGHVVARRYLFPTQRDVRLYDRIITQVEVWFDDSLNEEQRSAVQSVVHQAHTVPYLISGPPGTGKTKTVVEAVQQVLAHHPDASILLCAPSNTAADTLVRRLAPHLTPPQLLRLNSPARTFAEVPDSVMPYCHVENDTFRMPDFATLMKYRVIVCTCQDAGMLVTGRATNSDMMRVQRDLFSTLYPNRGPGSLPPPPIHPHWTHLFIDEAAQASEPETLIPLEVVLPWTDYSSRGVDGVKDPVVVLCGDVHQLGPVITSRAARDGELDVSLLERLFRHDLYQFPGRDDSANDSTRVVRSHSPQSPSLCCTHLVRNYRSIAPILMVPASLFYNDTLIASASNVSMFPWTQLPNPRIPILFQGNDSEEWTPDDGASWCNIGEIAHVVAIVKDLFSPSSQALRNDQPLKQNEVAVITPWKEQVWRIRKALRDWGFHGIDVGHVEVYQGAEFRVTILSCVRSRARHLASDRLANAGLYGEPKRFNVAITRAKELLVVVGNANLLKGDPYWNGFLQVMLRNKLYCGPEIDMQITPAYISKIESQMMKDQPMSAEDAALMLSGAMARDLLLD